MTNQKVCFRIFYRLPMAFLVVGGLLLAHPSFAKEKVDTIPVPPMEGPAKKNIVKKSFSVPPFSMYTSSKRFPSSASSLKKLRILAKKHHETQISWKKGEEFRLWFMLMSRPKKSSLRKGDIFVVIAPAGKGEHLAFNRLSVTKKTKTFLSPLAFSGEFKKNVRYELRAERIKMKKGKRFKSVIARSYFRLK